MRDKKMALVTGCSSGIGYAHVLSLHVTTFRYASVRHISKAEKIQEIINCEKLPLKMYVLM